ncbi:hypothetical protein GCM10027280_06990 [Micromonospora polyrhachis]
MTKRIDPPSEPENISIIDAVMATIGSTMSNCVHWRAGGGGISGGAWRISSPAGISGAGRRGGLCTTTVATSAIVREHRRRWGAMAGKCREPLAALPRGLAWGSTIEEERCITEQTDSEERFDDGSDQRQDRR